MVDPKLLEYIKQKVGSGSSKEAIKASLLQAGWTDAEVQEGFNGANPSPISPMPSTRPLEALPNTQAMSGFARPRKSSPNIFVLLLVLILLVGVVGGGAYVYLNKSSLFGTAPYTQENLLSGLLTKNSGIHSASYSVSASLVMAPREADAMPFTTKLSNSEELKKQYANDAKRAQDVSNIVSNLRNNSYGGSYPAKLQYVIDNKSEYSYSSFSGIDPATKKPYGYAATENGKNFALSVTFETDSAISSISQVKKSYRSSDTQTIISGKTVTFTQDSPPYFYLPLEPPKPFFVTLSESMANVPPEVNATFSATAQSDFSKEGSPDWKFNADATGDFGDLTYKFNADALKKDALYYLRINNMPSFFFGYIGLEKGQWVKIDPSNKSALGSFYPDFSALSKTEESYKENRQKVTEFLKKMIAVADSEHVLMFKNPPKKETIGGRTLYRYDLAFNKEAIVSFYKKMGEEYSKGNLTDSYPSLVDQGYLQYLESPEFDEAFDYYQKNTSLTLWVDSNGFTSIVSYTMRIVPADTATQLKDKQANVTFKLELSDINKPVIIEAPTDAKDIGDMFPAQKNSAIEGSLSTILVNGAVYYDNSGSYANFCTSDNYKKPAATIADLGGTPMCRVNAANNAFCACSSFNVTPSQVYCIDSTGYKNETANTCSSACTTNGKCAK